MKIDAATRAVELATNFTVGDYLDAVARDPPDQPKEEANGVNSSLLTEWIEKCYKAWYGETASGAISKCRIPCDLPGQ